MAPSSDEPVKPAVDIATQEASEDVELDDASGPALVVLWSPDEAAMGTAHTIGERLRVGRAGGADLDVALADPKLSRSHAVIARQDDSSLRIEDQASTNGIRVGGLRVRARAIVPGDIIRAGDTIFEIARCVPPASCAAGDDELIGRSPVMGDLLAAIDRVAATRIAVLVTGPTGAGKELVARRLHHRSGRSGPFVAINCGALPANLVEATLFGHRRGAFTDATSDSPGHFGSAEGGTLFLDEIGLLPLALQPKLLRALDAREYTPVGAATPRRSDVRIVAATNVELRSEVAAGRFRRDLFARVAEEVIAVPPLSQRRADIPLLVRHFLDRLAPGRPFNVGAALHEALLIHEFSMNVRELRAAIQHVVLVAAGNDLLPSYLPEGFRRGKERSAAATTGVPDEPPGREELEVLLARHRGNLARVADHYGKARGQIYRWLRRHGLVAGDYRS